MRSTPLVVCVVVLSISQLAMAVLAPRESDSGAVLLPTEQNPGLRGPYRAQSAGKLGAWTDFTGRHGDWDVLWNDWTDSPSRAIGEAIELGRAISDARTAHAEAVAFLRRESSVSKATSGIELSERSTVRARSIWYAHLKQTVDGIEVLNTDVTVRLSPAGRIMAFGSEIRDDIQVDTTPWITAEMARDKALDGLYFDANADHASGGEELFILPVEGVEGTNYHLVRRVRVSQASPPHEWESFIDAHDGSVVWRFDRVRYGSVSGNVTGRFKARVPSDPTTTINFPDIEVNFPGGTDYSDAAGNYSIGGISGSNSLTALVEGQFARVFRQDAASGSFSTVVNADTNPTGVVVNLATAAAGTETNGFYHTNVVHDYIKAIDPGFTDIDYQMSVNVNINDTCNAFWNGFGINFFKAGNGCNNTVWLADVVYHEYGHGINDKLYEQLGSASGMINGALHEGLADVTAQMLEDDPVLGQEFNIGDPSGIRDADNTITFPQDVTGEVHADGEIISGAFWDLRQAVGLATAEELAHFAKYGLPDHTQLKRAFQEYFIETLIADDDNGNLGDGTPHWNEIIASFNLHGIGPSLYVTITHTEHADQTDAVTALTIDADISSSSGIFPVDASSPELAYQVDGGSASVLPLVNTGADSYEASFANPGAAHLVSYQLSAAAQEGNLLSSPQNPSLSFSFLVGTQIQIRKDEFEVLGGWTVNDGTDDATTGIWARVEPFGTYSGGLQVQPEQDYSNPGTLCFVTGNNHGGDPSAIGADDVDDGKTTLLSPIVDLSGANRPVVRYWRWFTNAAGAAPGEDPWQVDISNDGGSSWVSLENTTNSHAAWWKQMFLVENYVAPTNNMRLRFIASDYINGSLVEAAVDDVEFLEFEEAVATPELPRFTSLAQNAPNPFNPSTTIRFALARRGPVSLKIYDAAGRLVRTLVDGPLEATDHELEWSGRDDGGVRVSSGVYLYRLVADDFVQTRRMVLIK